MKNFFENDYSCIKLSKYFLLFLDKMCSKLNFEIYYNAHTKSFIVSDSNLKQNKNYSYYKNKQDIKSEIKNDNVFYDQNYNWTKKNIILFNKEEPYEENDGEMYFPDHYDCNHDIEFKMNLPNIQKILLCIFKNPILAKESYYLKDIFQTDKIEIFFPSKNLSINPMLDLLFLKHLDKKYLFSALCKHDDNLISYLTNQSDEYKILFFKSFEKSNNLSFKNCIFKVIDEQHVLEPIFTYHSDFLKFLETHKPNNFFTKETENLSLFKSFFNVKNLSVIYHDKFDELDLRNYFLEILKKSSFQSLLNEKGIIIHSSFYDYTNSSVVSFIENKSTLEIKQIEDFFIDMFKYIEPTKDNNSNLINDKILKNLESFFNYYYLTINNNSSKNIIKKTAKI